MKQEIKKQEHYKNLNKKMDGYKLTLGTIKSIHYWLYLLYYIELTGKLKKMLKRNQMSPGKSLEK